MGGTFATESNVSSAAFSTETWRLQGSQHTRLVQLHLHKMKPYVLFPKRYSESIEHAEWHVAATNQTLLETSILVNLFGRAWCMMERVCFRLERCMTGATIDWSCFVFVTVPMPAYPDQ